ncbi:EPIDERMAL PATTERNING FACTOR-like protein 4 isoform X2 [Musa acuminata AAA Group]|uniref:EPIDERMAL PATTERNING FACTOR-like protein 4 isoform X2 n=1 Tax=Musa acuminata AAA Group TaxID=214697 RepID=UPI0031DA95AF
MESRRVRRRHGFMMKEAITLCCGFIFLFSLFAVLSSSSYRRSVRLGVRSLMATDPHSQVAVAARRRKLVGGPGSYPPRCTGKCGDCTPCNPVHVAVPPGTPVTTEYYPEAWRCKCGNKLYMP